MPLGGSELRGSHKSSHHPQVNTELQTGQKTPGKNPGALQENEGEGGVAGRGGRQGPALGTRGPSLPTSALQHMSVA